MYPGSFNPPTIAHVAIAELALAQCRLDSITFAVSRRALAKEAADDSDRPQMTDRVRVLEEMTAARVGFEFLVTDDQLIVDIADGFDVVVIGADKWNQIHDPVFYNSSEAQRDDALARLPDVALVPRPPNSTGKATTLEVDAQLAQLIEQVSSSRARAGDRDLMVAEAQAFDRATGAWTDPERYERHLAKNGESRSRFD